MTIHPARALLGSGVAAGILVPMLLWADGATRPGYSLWRHGASQLGTGERGWLQTLNFVLGGLLVAAFAVGLSRVLRPGRGAAGGPILLTVAAAGLALAGPVPTDPALGYPPGQPQGVTLSLGGRIHQVAGLALFGGLSAAAFVLARRLHPASPGWAIYSRLSGTVIIACAVAAGIAYRLDVQGAWRPAPAGLLEHASLLAGFCWIIAVSRHLLGTNANAAAAKRAATSATATRAPRGTGSE
jgi:Protein of unknown function (DUF998)